MTILNSVKQVTQENTQMVSIVLEVACWQGPINPNFQNFLALKANHKALRFKAMPTSLNSAPRLFTKLVAGVIRNL